MESNEQQLRQVMDDWHGLIARGELDAILPMMTEDALFLRCGLPPMSKTDYIAVLRESSGKARIESRFDIKEIHASGDVAYVWSYIFVAMTETATNRRTINEGYVLTIFRKSFFGQWLLARDANLLQGWNPD
jgi:ketosteroid isomerase-like protein